MIKSGAFILVPFIAGVCCALPLKAQVQINFNAGISDFKFDDFTKSFLAPGTSNYVDVIQTVFSNTQRLGAEVLMPFSDESSWGVSSSVSRLHKI